MRLFRTGLIAVVALLILTLGTLAQRNPAPITDKMVRRDTHDVDYMLGQFADIERDLKEAHWATDLGGHLDGVKKAAAEFKRELQAGKTWLSNVKTCDSPSTGCK